MKEKKKEILNEIYEKTIKLEVEAHILEVQLKKLTQQENYSKDIEIPKFLADMY